MNFYIKNMSKELKMKKQKRKINIKRLFLWYYHIITLLYMSFHVDYSLSLYLWAYCSAFIILSFKMISEEQEYKRELKKRGIA